MEQLSAQTTEVLVLKPYKELYNPKWRNIVYYGGRASGKSHAVAQALLIRGRQSRLRILCTREIQNTIKDSVHKLLGDLIDKYRFADYLVQKDTITNRLTGTEFFFKGLRLNVNEIKSTEGIDICWVEEAQSITETSLEILTPTIRKPGSQLIFTFNRFNELDPVYARFVVNRRPRTHVAQINYDLLERNGLLPEAIKTEMEADRQNPELYAHKWLGEPVSQSELSILPRSAILEAMRRSVAPSGADIIGVDVARMGGDRTVFWCRKGLQSTKFKVINQSRTTETCDALEQFAEFNTDTELRVDDTGVGGGVTDEMIKRGYNVTAINFGSRPSEADKYPNWISEAWFNFGSMLQSLGLIYNSDLLMELSTRQWRQDISGRRRVEGKNEYKKRGFRSPDLADAVIICYAEPRRLGAEDISL